MALRRSNISHESGLKLELEEMMPMLNTLVDLGNWLDVSIKQVDAYLVSGRKRDRTRFTQAIQKMKTLLIQYRGLIKMEEEEAIVTKLETFQKRIQYWANFAIQDHDLVAERRAHLDSVGKDLFATIISARKREEVLVQERRIAADEAAVDDNQLIILMALLVFMIAMAIVVALIRVLKKPTLSESEMAMLRGTKEDLIGLEIQFERLKSKIDNNSGVTRQPASKVISTILIVDNDANFVRGLSRLLKDVDCRVFRAFDEGQAVTEALRLRPDLILSGAGVAVSDDYELLKKLKSDHPLTPVVIMYDNGTELERLKWVPISVDRVISKKDPKLIVKSVLKEINQFFVSAPRDFTGQKECSILIVDQDKMAQKMLSEAFFLWNYPCVAVDSVKKAAELFGERSFGLMILDPNLPQKNGLDSLKEIRQSNPEIPIIICSREIEKADVAAYEKFGAYVGIRKPFDLGEVHEVIDNFCVYDPTTFKKWFQKVQDLYQSSNNKKTSKKKVA